MSACLMFVRSSETCPFAYNSATRPFVVNIVLTMTTRQVSYSDATPQEDKTVTPVFVPHIPGSEHQ